jgi:hypothetical protein
MQAVEEAVRNFVRQSVLWIVMGMFTNLLAKIFGSSTPGPSSTTEPPSTTIEAATAPSATSPTASAVSSLSASSAPPSEPDEQRE